MGVCPPSPSESEFRNLVTCTAKSLNCLKEKFIQIVFNYLFTPMLLEVWVMPLDWQPQWCVLRNICANNLYLNQFGSDFFPVPNLLELLAKMLQHCFAMKPQKLNLTFHWHWGEWIMTEFNFGGVNLSFNVTAALLPIVNVDDYVDEKCWEPFLLFALGPLNVVTLVVSSYCRHPPHMHKHLLVST